MTGYSRRNFMIHLSAASVAAGTGISAVLAAEVDRKVVGKAFTVEINGTFVPVKSYSGGDITEDPDVRHEEEEREPVYPYVTELNLVLFMTPSLAWLSLDKEAAKPDKDKGRFSITIHEQNEDDSPKRSLFYEDCILSSLDYAPDFESPDETMLYVTAWKPERVTVV